MTRPDAKGESKQSRRDFLLRAGATATGLVFAPALLAGRLGAAGPLPAAAGARQAVTRIGVIGSGNIGGAVGLKWAEAGHEIFFSSRHPEELMGLVERAGPKTRAGLPAEAAAFGEVVLIAVPYAALPQVGRDYAPLMQGKVVVDCGNPYPRRDGPMAEEALAKGTGVASAEFLPGVRLVRAFNTINYRSVEQEAHRAGEKVGIPIAGDDEDALRIVSALVVDAGFDPVVVGPLARAREFDQGSPVYVTDMTAAQLREALGLR
jgi:predicted dinucleotide-binding enzyme